jgi:CDP-glucose 4,6-dehydratase
LVQQAIKAFGSGSFEINQVSSKLHEAGLLKLDINKVITQLDWKPIWNASQTIKLTIDWYKAFLDLQNMDRFTEAQINLYFLND